MWPGVSEECAGKREGKETAECSTTNQSINEANDAIHMDLWLCSAFA